MPNQGSTKERHLEREQGDINTTPNRKRYWEKNLSGDARRWFEEDARYFLHQSLSTPVLNVISGAHGIYVEDLDGKQYMDMHGNGVHNAGFSNPQVIRAVKKDGWYVVRQKGSHMIMRHPHKPGPLIVPSHGAKEMSSGLMRAILKKAKMN